MLTLGFYSYAFTNSLSQYLDLSLSNMALVMKGSVGSQINALTTGLYMMGAQSSARYKHK